MNGDGSPNPKAPRIARGFYAATLDEAKIREWWTEWPSSWIGMWPGRSGLLVIDLDENQGKAGMSNWLAMPETNGEIGQCAMLSVSGTGTHVWFRKPEGVSITNRRG